MSFSWGFPYQALDANGNPYNGATLEFYLAGTSTAAAVYSSPALTTSLGVTVDSNSAGRFPSMWPDPTKSYKAILKFGGNTIWTEDPVSVDSTDGADFDLVDTIVNLKTKVGGYVTAVWVGGHTTIGDGGSGWFRWNAASAITDDNGAIIQPNAGGTGRWLREVGDYVDPRWWGINTSAAQTAINAALAFIENGYSRARRLYLPGSLTCTAALNDLDFQVEIFGDGINGTALTRNFNGSSGVGFLNIRASGVILRDFSPQSATGTSGGDLINIKTTGSTTIGSVTLANLYCTTTGTNTHVHTLYVDGTTSLTNLGVRTLKIENCEFFGATTYAAYFAGVKNLYWHSGSTYVAGGTSADIFITGTSSVKSEGVSINISDSGNVTVDADFCTSADIFVMDPSGHLKRSGNESPTSEITLRSGGMDDKNIIVNGGFQVNQRAATSVSDDVYCFDRWYALHDGGSVTVGLAPSVETYQPNAIRLTQPDVSAKRIGLAQIVEFQRMRQLRSAYVTISGRVRSSVSQAIRFAVLEWTGSADVVTSDVVLSWASSTYTANNFFLAASVNPLLVSSFTPSANVTTPFSARAQVNTGANNLIFFVWTEGTFAQNATLDIGKCMINRGSAAAGYMDMPFEEELRNCERYYEKSFPYLTAPAQNTSATNASKFIQPVGASASTQTDDRRFRTRKRTAPTMTYYNPSAANAQARSTAAADCSATATYLVGEDGFSLTLTTAAGSAAGAANMLHWTADAEL